jgi:dipeptidyl aminopeptidase/acylaminoacyl peptidase
MYKLIVISLLISSLYFAYPNLNAQSQSETSSECEFITRLGDAILNVIWSNDGNKLIIQSREFKELLQVWDVRFGELLDMEDPLFTPMAWQQSPSSLFAWNLSGNRMALINDTNEVNVYDGFQTLLYSLENPASNITWSADGNLIATNKYNDQHWILSIWDATNGELLYTNENEIILQFAFSPVGNQFIAAVRPDNQTLVGSLEIRDGETNEVLVELISQTDDWPFPRDLTWSHDGLKVIAKPTNTPNPYLIQWDATTGNQIQSNLPSVLTFDWFETTIAGVDATGQSLIIWDTHEDKELVWLDLSTLLNSETISDVKWSPTGNYLSFTTTRGSVFVCDFGDI